MVPDHGLFLLHEDVMTPVLGPPQPLGIFVYKKKENKKVASPLTQTRCSLLDYQMDRRYLPEGTSYIVPVSHAVLNHRWMLKFQSWHTNARKPI